FFTAAEFAQAIERACGREHTGTHADVARLMEAIFGLRMATRQAHIREAIGSSNLDRLLAQSGLPRRERASLAAPPPIAELAPPAPSGRYSFGHISPEVPNFRPRRVPWKIVGAVSAALATGALGTALAMASCESKPRPIVVTARESPPPI